VHADYSSYNLLYYERELVMIDVGQSVENDHPKYKYFIKRDISNFTHQYQSIIEDLEDYDHLNIVF